MKNQNSKLFVSLVLIVALFGCLFLGGQNAERAFVIGLLFALWVGVAIKTRDLVKSSLLLLVVASSLNITMQLTPLVGRLGAKIDGVMVPYLVPTVHLIDVFLVVLVLSGAYIFGKRIVRKYSLPLIIAIGYFIIHNLIFSNFVTLVISGRYLLMFLGGIVIYEYVYERIAAKDFMKLKRLLNEVLIVVAVSVMIQFVISAFQVMLGHSIGLDLIGESRITGSFYGVSYLNTGLGSILRAYGTFPHPNVLSGFYLGSLLLFLFSALKLGGKSKVFVLFMAVLASIGILLTFSRTGLILGCVVWAFSLAVYFLLKRKTNSRQVKKLSIIAIPVNLLDRTMELFNGASASVNERISLMNNAISLISVSPILGVGIGRFVFAMGGNAPQNSLGISIFEPVHNIFALLLVENGLIVGGLILMLFLFLLFSAVKSSSTYSRILLVCSTIIVITAGMFDHYLLTFAQGNILLMVYLLLILLIAKFNVHEKR